MPRILHITLLISVLFSSTSLVLNKHYCSDLFVNASLMTVPESCHSEDPMPDCPTHSQDQDDCCTNEVQLLKTELNHDLHQPQLKTFLIAKIFTTLFFLQDSPFLFQEDDIYVSLKNWKPPAPAAVSLPVLQQFLC